MATGKKMKRGSSEVPARRRRLPPEDRRREIIEEATRYFAEVGLNGGTLALAKRLGITQPLLYKYFPTKEALIETVFERLFPGHWDPRWETLLGDRSIPMRERLKRFYRDFATAVLTYEHVRLFLFSGLANWPYNSRYYDILVERIFSLIVRGLRAECDPDGAANLEDWPVSEEELELVQSLHAAIYHIRFRNWLHNPPLRGDILKLVDAKVDFFMDGADTAMRRLAEAPKRNSTRRRAGA